MCSPYVFVSILLGGQIVTCKLAFTLIYLVVKEGDSGRAGWRGGVKEPLPFSLLPRPNSLPLQHLPRRLLSASKLCGNKAGY